jgi:hypothetical protein
MANDPKPSPAPGLGARLVNVPAAIPAPHAPDAPPPPPQPAVGVFLTPQSLATFPAASSIVTTVWMLLKAVAQNAPWATSGWTVVVIALFVGMLIYMMSYRPTTNLRDKVVVVGIAVLNSLMLAAAAFGIVTAGGSSGASSGPGPK